MSTWQIILIAVAFSCIAALVVAAVMGRMNGDDDITETDKDEPLGDMVDIRSLINKYED